jgi:hypothetical protein
MYGKNRHLIVYDDLSIGQGNVINNVGQDIIGEVANKIVEGFIDKKDAIKLLAKHFEKYRERNNNKK